MATGAGGWQLPGALVTGAKLEFEVSVHVISADGVDLPDGAAAAVVVARRKKAWKVPEARAEGQSLIWDKKVTFTSHLQSAGGGAASFRLAPKEYSFKVRRAGKTVGKATLDLARHLSFEPAAHSHAVELALNTGGRLNLLVAGRWVREPGRRAGASDASDSTADAAAGLGRPSRALEDVAEEAGAAGGDGADGEDGLDLGAPAVVQTREEILAESLTMLCSSDEDDDGTTPPASVWSAVRRKFPPSAAKAGAPPVGDGGGAEPAEPAPGRHAAEALRRTSSSPLAPFAGRGEAAPGGEPPAAGPGLGEAERLRRRLEAEEEKNRVMASRLYVIENQLQAREEAAAAQTQDEKLLQELIETKMKLAAVEAALDERNQIVRAQQEELEALRARGSGRGLGSALKAKLGDKLAKTPLKGRRGEAPIDPANPFLRRGEEE